MVVGAETGASALCKDDNPRRRSHARGKGSALLTATKDLVLPTTVTGSWPRPTWFTGNLLERPFSSGMADVAYREQYVDAVSTVLADQELAGLDILTNGDYHLDADL